MKKWIIGASYVMISTLITVASVMSAWLAFVANPINWKNYRDYHSIDYVMLWGSNGLILVIALTLSTIAWVGLWKVKTRLAKRVAGSD